MFGFNFNHGGLGEVEILQTVISMTYTNIAGNKKNIYIVAKHTKLRREPMTWHHLS